MRKYLVLLIAILVIVSTSNAQYKGVRGRKFSVSYQPSFSFMMKGSDYFINQNFLFHNSLNVSYSPFKFLTVGLSGSMVKRELDGYRNGYDSTSMYVNDQTVGLSILYHRQIKHGFAPGGKYFGIRVDFGLQNGRTLIQNDDYDPEFAENCSSCDDEYGMDVYYDERNRQSLMVFSLVFGRNLIFKDRYLFGYGIQWGFGTGDNQPLRYIAKPFMNIGIIL